MIRQETAADAAADAVELKKQEAMLKEYLRGAK